MPVHPTSGLCARALALITLCALVLTSACRESGSASGVSQSQAEARAIRIVALSPAVAVMLRDLGLEDEIVGRHAWDMTLPESIPIVGEQGGVDYEALLRVRPTHVYTQLGAGGVPDRLTELAGKNNWHLEDYRLLTLDDVASAMDDLYLDLVRQPAGPGIEDAAARAMAGEQVDPDASMRLELPSERLGRAWRDRGPQMARAGRVLLLASVDPPGALGPGSFHHDLLVRMGGTPAIDDGAPWIELDAEDVLRLSPDAIVLFAPRDRTDASAARDAQFSRPRPAWEGIEDQLGLLAELDIPAVRNRRVAVIKHPLGLLPSSSLAEVADQMAQILDAWAEIDLPDAEDETP